MKQRNLRRAKAIFLVWLIATAALLLLGYSVRKPKITRQEFPFTITYSYQGRTETISDVYVAEYAAKAKYLADDSLSWYGYVKDRNRLEADFYRIGEADGQVFSINLNILPGKLMGDPRYADGECRPAAVCHMAADNDETVITDPAELEKLGFFLVSWEYPQPIENSFGFGGIAMSSETVLFTSALALGALLACMILIRKDPALTLGKVDKLSAALNFPVMLAVFPFIFLAAALSEITADVSFLQQLLYLTPALTVLGVAASVTLRRCGQGKYGLAAQFVGPVLFALLLLAETF